MIRELIHDPIILAQKSEAATSDDRSTANDLLETLISHKETCVGMAANMIGVRKRIIAFFDEASNDYFVMYNPEIIKKSEPYNTEEGCLSLLGAPRSVKRFKKITVRYQNENMLTRIKTYTGFTAQIIEHEVDHCNGILI